jgi:hypothetical protein
LLVTSLDTLASEAGLRVLLQMLRPGKDEQDGWLARNLAAQALGMLGDRATVAVPALRAISERRGTSAWSHAVEALGRIDPAQFDHLESLWRAKRSPHLTAALAHIARRAATELPAELERVLGSEPGDEPPAASAPVRALRLLLHTYAREATQERAEIIRLLGGLGEPSLPLLRDALARDEMQVRIAALAALRKATTGKQRYIPLLTDLLHGTAEEVRYEVIETLATWGCVGDPRSAAVDPRPARRGDSPWRRHPCGAGDGADRRRGAAASD